MVSPTTTRNNKRGEVQRILSKATRTTSKRSASEFTTTNLGDKLDFGGTRSIINCLICNTKGHLSQNCPKMAYGIHLKGAPIKARTGLLDLQNYTNNGKTSVQMESNNFEAVASCACGSKSVEYQKYVSKNCPQNTCPIYSKDTSTKTPSSTSHLSRDYHSTRTTNSGGFPTILEATPYLSSKGIHRRAHVSLAPSTSNEIDFDDDDGTEQSRGIKYHKKFMTSYATRLHPSTESLNNECETGSPRIAKVTSHLSSKTLHRQHLVSLAPSTSNEIDFDDDDGTEQRRGQGLQFHCQTPPVFPEDDLTEQNMGLGLQSPTQTSPTQTSKPKRKRGKTLGYKLAKLRKKGERFGVMFPRHVNRPVGQYSTLFTTEIGVLVRQNAPLQAKSWTDVSSEKKDMIMSLLRAKFIFSEEPGVIFAVQKSMAIRYSSWRYRIHQKFLKYKSLAAALSNAPPFGLLPNDWRYLCNLFSTEKYKGRSRRSKTNRKKLRTTHCAGTKAFSKIRYDKRNPETQAELGFVETYETTHVKADGLWVHDNAHIFHTSMKEHKEKADSEGRSLTDEQLSVLTFGRKSGYICGLGRGPQPTTSTTGKRTRADLERETYEATQRAEAAERELVEARRERAEMAERMKILEAQQVDHAMKIREEVSLQLSSMRQQQMRTPEEHR